MFRGCGWGGRLPWLMPLGVLCALSILFSLDAIGYYYILLQRVRPFTCLRTLCDSDPRRRWPVCDLWLCKCASPKAWRLSLKTRLHSKSLLSHRPNCRPTRCSSSGSGGRLHQSHRFLRGLWSNGPDSEQCVEKGACHGST